MDTPDLLPDGNKLFHQMKLFFIVLKDPDASLQIVIDAVTADSQLLGHLTEGIVI